MMKNDNQRFYRVRVSRVIQLRFRNYFAKNGKQKIIPLLDKIIGDWLAKKGF